MNLIMRMCFFFFSIALFGCEKAQYSAGQCVMSPDGYKYQIESIEGDTYKVKQWTTAKPNQATQLEVGRLAGFVKIDCPN